MQTTMENEVERRAKQLTCLPVVSRGCCCSLAACCATQGALTVFGGICGLGIEGVSVGALASLLGRDDLTEEQRTAVKIVLGINVVVTVIVVITLILAILFLVGISKKRPSYLQPYIVMFYIHIALTVLMIVFAICGFLPAINILGYLIGLALTSYCLVCTNSLRVRMIAERLVAGEPNTKMPFRA